MLLSSTLPLPVEFVAGGDGSPESTEDEGLGGSGRSGMAGGEGFGVDPMNIADKGRDLGASAERRVIGRERAARNSSRKEELK